jgi:hypothetical protein
MLSRIRYHIEYGPQQQQQQQQQSADLSPAERGQALRADCGLLPAQRHAMLTLYAHAVRLRWVRLPTE